MQGVADGVYDACAAKGPSTDARVQVVSADADVGNADQISVRDLGETDQKSWRVLLKRMGWP